MAREKEQKVDEALDQRDPSSWRRYLAIMAEALAKRPLQSCFRIAMASGFIWLLLYWTSIGFLPDASISSLLLLLISAAVVGAVMLFVVIAGFIMPHVLWTVFWENVKVIQGSGSSPLICSDAETPEPRYPHKSFFLASIAFSLFLLLGVCIWGGFHSNSAMPWYFPWACMAIFLFFFAGIWSRLEELAKGGYRDLVFESAMLILFISFLIFIPIVLGAALTIDHNISHYAKDDVYAYLEIGLVVASVFVIGYVGSIPPDQMRTSGLGTIGVLVMGTALMVLIPTGAPTQIARSAASLLGLTRAHMDIYVRAEACTAVPKWLSGETCSEDGHRHVLRDIEILSRVGPRWWLEARITPRCEASKPSPAAGGLEKRAIGGGPRTYHFTLPTNDIISIGTTVYGARSRCPKSDKKNAGASVLKASSLRS